MKRLFSKIMIMAAAVLTAVLLPKGVAEAEEPSEWSAVFNGEYYLNSYADLRAAFGNDINAALDHYLTFGLPEGRIAEPSFDVYSYRNRYLDLRNAFGTDLRAFAAHFCKYGKSEGRIATDCPYIEGPEYTDPTGSVAVISADNSTGIFSVRLSDIVSPSGVSNVLFPVWSEENGQDDIIWAPADRQADGSYIMTYDAALLGGKTGKYIIHCYLTAGNGIMSFMGATEVTIQVPDLPSKKLYYETIGNGVVRMHAAGLYDAAKVEFMAWSEEYGQDDVKAHQGTYEGSGGRWYADIDWHQHGRDGYFHCHVWVTNNAGEQYLYEATDFTLTVNGSVSQDVINDMSSATNYLIAVSRYDFETTVYQGSRGNWTPVRIMGCTVGETGSRTPSGTYKIESKGYSFSGPKNAAYPDYTCYYYSGFIGSTYMFHSVLYQPGTFNIIDNSMGEDVSHGCIRLLLDDAEFIYRNIPLGTKVYIY